jgi:LuxR family maltose regulon positive regulatory protein
MVQGQLRKAAQICQKALDLAAQHGRPSLGVAASPHSQMGRLHYEWNELDAAEQHVERAFELSEQWGNVDQAANNAVTLARVRHARGDIAGARDALARLEQMIRGHALTPPAAEQVAAQQVRLWLALGDLASASRWMRQSTPQAYTDGQSVYVRELGQITRARVLLAQGQAGQALSLLDPLLQAAQSGKRAGRAIEVLALHALALQSQGREDEAVTALAEALALAEPEGYVRIFVDAGPAMAQLLLSLQRRIGTDSALQIELGQRLPAPSLEYVVHLIKAFGTSPVTSQALDAGTPPVATARGVQTCFEPLSERELQVLRLIAAGRSNREIADELVIAVSTVKSHVNHIHGKLGVKSRTQAVARARTLNLL